MDPLPVLRELFPYKAQNQIQTIINLVEEGNPQGTYEQKIEQMYDMLFGETGPEDVIQGQLEDDPDDELLEGAVGYGHLEPVNSQVLNSNFNNLQSIFPDAAPDFLWDFCHKKGTHFNLDDAIDELTRDGYDQIVLDSYVIWERLKDALPAWDPSYLEKQAEKLAAEDPKSIENFVSAALENNDFPTMEQYLKRKKEEGKINSFKETNFKLETFLEVFPDPEAHFRDQNRQNPLKQDNIPEEDLIYAKTFLYNRYPDIRKRHVDVVFKIKQMRLIDCCEMLDTIKKGLRVKRREEEMPDTNNMGLLQEVMFIKHRRLIRRLLKYKDETYRKFKEEARALNLLETCGVCAEDELIPEECFNCQKGCVFCKDCVKRYVEVRMGDGLTKFPCCNECDSEFSLYILQMVLPRHTFERLVLKIQSDELKEANVEGIETCPFCDFAYIPLENSTIFKCENEECLKESCRLCRHESHIPKRCDEIEYDEDVRRRTYIENMMTEALARTCLKCKKKFVKSNGCNKMVCICGAMQCYLCSQPVTGYQHFGDGRCQLLTNDSQIDLTRVQQRAQQAKQELGNVKIKFDPSVGIENYFPAQ